MQQIQVESIPSSQEFLLPSFARNFRAALSYLAFYSTDSPFVIQAIQKLSHDFQQLLSVAGSLVLYIQKGRIHLNGSPLSDTGDLSKIMEEKKCHAILFRTGMTHAEWMGWLRKWALPFEKSGSLEQIGEEPTHIQVLSENEFMVIPSAAPLQDSPPAIVPSLESLPTVSIQNPVVPVTVVTVKEDIPQKENPVSIQALPVILKAETSTPPDETLLSFLVEAWQFSQLLRKDLDSSLQSMELTTAFDRLFERLLDRLEKASPEFESVSQWFKSPPGEVVEKNNAKTMFPLLQIAVEKGWTAVLFDPATQGLVSDCLAHWGADGRHDLVEKTVSSLAGGLKGVEWERQLALGHLMDARPWIHQAELLERVLRELNSLLAKETQPSLYQSALLLSWDLIEPALGASREAPVLNLLATLHFHADEDSSPFPERTSIARHWLFEKSTPQLILRLVRCAYQAGQLGRYPLLGEKAAPFLLQSFLDAAPSDKNSYYPLFAEMRLPLQMSLLERLSGIEREVDLKYLLPVLRVCGVDPSLSFQLSPWMAKGSRELKLNLISLIEEIGDPAGGPSLRVALFDDAEEIASLAARVTGKIHFLPATSLLEKVTAIRKKRFGAEEKFLISVCQALGDLAQPSSIPFLMETAKKKSVLERGQTVPLAVRLEAVQALVKINKPEVWTFVKSLMEEKNPSMEETINRIIEERVEKG